MACATQPILLAHSDSSTRLHDSVRQATPQVQLCSRDFGGILRRPCPALPIGEGCQSCSSSRDEAGDLGKGSGKWCVAKYGDPYSEFVLCI